MLTRKKSLDKNVPTTTRLLKLCKDNAYMIAPAFHGLGVFMPNVIIQTLMLQKLAIQMPNPITSLNSTNDTSKDATNDVQTQAAQCLLVLSLVRQLPSIIVSLQLGPWSDKYGRKFVIMMSITGAILTNVCYLLNSYYLDSSAIYLILSGLPVGLLGDYGAFVMALFGHVKEITNFDSLSPKIAILDGIEMVTSELGPLIGTTLFVNFGFMSVFAGCIIFHGLGILSAYLTISQKPIKICKTMIRDMCHCEGYLQSVRSIVKKRDNNKRTYILVLFMITAIIAFGMSGKQISEVKSRRIEQLARDTNANSVCAAHFSSKGLSHFTSISYHLRNCYNTVCSILGNMEINYLYTVSKLDWDVTMNTYFIALIGGLAAVGNVNFVIQSAIV